MARTPIIPGLGGPVEAELGETLWEVYYHKDGTRARDTRTTVGVVAGRTERDARAAARREFGSQRELGYILHVTPYAAPRFRSDPEEIADIADANRDDDGGVTEVPNGR